MRYVAGTGKLMAVELTTTAALLADVPKALFSGPAEPRPYRQQLSARRKSRSSYFATGQLPLPMLLLITVPYAKVGNVSIHLENPSR